MKKQIKKLNLNKRTISNLNASEMNQHVGGAKTQGNGHTCTQCQTNANCGTGYCTASCHCSGAQVCITF